MCLAHPKCASARSERNGQGTTNLGLLRSPLPDERLCPRLEIPDWVLKRSNTYNSILVNLRRTKAGLTLTQRCVIRVTTLRWVPSYVFGSDRRKGEKHASTQGLRHGMMEEVMSR